MRLVFAMMLIAGCGSATDVTSCEDYDGDTPAEMACYAQQGANYCDADEPIGDIEWDGAWPVRQWAPFCAGWCDAGCEAGAPSAGVFDCPC